jgi:hypothetical protein
MEENKPFENKYSSYRAINEIKEEKQDVITLKLNAEERKQLEIDKAALQQEKDGGVVSELSQKEIDKLVAQGYIVETVD